MNTIPQTRSCAVRTRHSRALVTAVAAALCAAGIAAVSPQAHSHEPEQTRSSAVQLMSSQLHASPSQVRLAQEALRERGFDPGRVDGIWGDSTADAVRRFQKSNNLNSTGVLDTSLMSALDIGDVLEGETSASFLDGLLSAERTKSKGAAGNGAPLFVSPVHVAQIQHVLHEQGFYKGAVDGVWGESTARAVNQYRSSMRMDADTGIDIALLQALNRESRDLPKMSAQLSSRAEPVPLRAGPATLRALQRELNAKGHNVGAVDGEWGENTRNALRQYQREHELESTGTLTLPTLAALGIDIRNPRQVAEAD